MNCILLFCVLFFLCFFAVTDVRSGRIPNKGLICLLFGGVLLRLFLGMPFWGDFLKLWLVLLLGIPLYLMGAVGAGDIKLVMVLAAVCGIEYSAQILLRSVISLAVYSLSLMMRKGILRSRLRYFHNYMNLILSGVFLPYSMPEQDRDIKIPLAPWVLVGYLWWILEMICRRGR